MGDFNVEPNDATMKNLCQIRSGSGKKIVKDNACFKNPINTLALTWQLQIDENPFEGLR